ncbi:MAG: heavy metal translocating P-type ATPase [Anaerolineales bacterium]
MHTGDTFVSDSDLAQLRIYEVPVGGMDCAECRKNVQSAIESIPGVRSVTVFLAAEKAVISADPSQVDEDRIRVAIQSAGYTVPDALAPEDQSSTEELGRHIKIAYAIIVAAVLAIAIFGEWMGIFDRLNAMVPPLVGAVIVAIAGWPVLRKVFHALSQKTIIAQTVMSLGVFGALIIGEWITALIIVFFMRVGDAIESYTTNRARSSVKNLTAMIPRTACIIKEGVEDEVPIEDVREGDIVLMRPGETVPVDGVVRSGQAAVDQSSVTGESIPVDVYQGIHVYAATIIRQGSVQVRTTKVGEDTTFGHVVRMVEEAEANRSEIQSFADKFSGYFLPLVLLAAALTYIISRDPLATVAVLVVSCSCAIALATPIAMLASVGAAAKHGLLIKGGKYIEALARADVLLIDKTGTVTFGEPSITDIRPINGYTADELIRMTASVEAYSEHALAGAVIQTARDQNIDLEEITDFSSTPGGGVQANYRGSTVRVGNEQFIVSESDIPGLEMLETPGKTRLLVSHDGLLVGVIAASDTMRPEVPEALKAIRDLGVDQMMLLTGDNQETADSLAAKLNIPSRANLLPEDKIKIVEEYQSRGHYVVMIGDGVNDAPALAKADVGIAMGVAGSDIAIETAHIALMREDWSLIPQLFEIANRTMGVVKMNLAFTGVFNLLGITLAAFGILPPVLAAAAQSIPDIAILTNSSRLLDQ